MNERDLARTQARKDFESRQIIIQLARTIRDQSHLESILSDTKSRIMRREVYELLKPHLTFQSTYEGAIAELHLPETRTCTWRDPILGGCKSLAGFEKANESGQVWADLCPFHNTKYEKIQSNGISRLKLQANVYAHNGQPLEQEAVQGG